MTVDIYEPVPGETFGKLAPMLLDLPIFKGNPTASTVVQQRLTNCPLPALLAAIAHADPNRLYRMIHYNGYSRPRSVWFHGRPLPNSGETLESEKTLTVNFQHRTIEISPRLYADEYAMPPKPRFGYAKDGSGWVSYIEKAYVVYRGNYNYGQLDFLGGASDPLSVERVVEDIATDFDKLDIDDRTLFRDFEPVSFDPPPGVVETFESTEENTVDLPRQGRMRRTVRGYLARAGTHPTIATNKNHTRAVLGLDKETVTLFDCMIPRTLLMPLRDFINEHEAIYQVRK